MAEEALGRRLDKVARFAEEGKGDAAADQLAAFADRASDLAPDHLAPALGLALAEEASLVVLGG